MINWLLTIDWLLMIDDWWFIVKIWNSRLQRSYLPSASCLLLMVSVSCKIASKWPQRFHCSQNIIGTTPVGIIHAVHLFQEHNLLGVGKCKIERLLLIDHTSKLDGTHKISHVEQETSRSKRQVVDNTSSFRLVEHVANPKHLAIFVLSLDKGPQLNQHVRQRLGVQFVLWQGNNKHLDDVLLNLFRS